MGKRPETAFYRSKSGCSCEADGEIHQPFCWRKDVNIKSNEEMYHCRIETGGTAGEIIKNAKLRKFWEHTINDGRGSDSES